MTGPAGAAALTRRGLLTAAVAVVLLAAGSTVAIAAATGEWTSTSSGTVTRSGPTCSAPALPGTTVSVRLVDMRSMMRGGMTGGSDGRMGQGDWRHFTHGMMRILASAASAPAGTVSLTVTDAGYLTHELVVLPLAAGQQPGIRTIGSDGKVDWVSLHLPAGRYELVCNLPGHYAAGMHAEPDVT